MPPPQQTVKTTLHNVLAGESAAPLTIENFETFLKQEHSEENLEFWVQVMRYRDAASAIYNIPSMTPLENTGAPRDSQRSLAMSFKGSLSNVNRGFEETALKFKLESDNGKAGGDGKAGGGLHRSGSNPGLTSDEVAVRTEKLKQLAEEILSGFVVEGSVKEINIPSLIRKKLVTEIRDNHNYNPEVFSVALEKVYEMMKTHSFPNFYKKATKEMNKP
ncbi:RGS domain-containing protein [Cladochytrium replicatum]|nr:RGS domain-containing protein [Cladochytrium replicatum]